MQDGWLGALRAGKFRYHIDYWDAIENQDFLSFEAVQHVIGQLTTLGQAPRGLEQPDFTVMRKFADCEVRRCAPTPHTRDRCPAPQTCRQSQSRWCSCAGARTDSLCLLGSLSNAAVSGDHHV